VLKVPVGSLFRRGEDWAVFVVNDAAGGELGSGHVTSLVPVKLGQRNDTEGEILEGLSEGQTLVLHPPDTLKDGTRINGFIVKPPDYMPGRRYPTLLWLHGGPVSQYANSFTTAWQIFASSGYVVLGVNPRGSSGRGESFATAIYADWGNKDTEDVLAAVDYAVKQGVADPDRLGVGGWSYGGILTNFVISKDTRFKSATSGASISNVLAGYGTDMYVREYEQELGTPWKNLDVWLHNSYPFLHADRIKTPTLFQCGSADFNVPLPNSEQMYQALRSLGVETQLVIYPDQYHGLTKPSYLRERMQRYLDWHGKYLQQKPRAEITAR